MPSNENLARAHGVATDALAFVRQHALQNPDIERAASRLLNFTPRVLVSGLCSVGKSSFVSALWGDSELLPTAVRDCTQTNTLIRVPKAGETDRTLRLNFLPRDKALAYALRGLAFHRIAGLIEETLGPTGFGPRLDELPPHERLTESVRLTRALFKERPSLFVLHEQVTDDLEEIEQFLAFLDSPDCKPGGTADARWEDRREHLMGRRRPDGRTLEVGKLLSLEHVEVIRATPRWTINGGKSPWLPEVLDTPWIPAYHEARRTELIHEQARGADILIVLALPQAFTFEEWVLKTLRERPELVKRTIVLFNQIDTVDTAALFTRDGFATVFQNNLNTLTKLGIAPENVLLSCARLPFLTHSPDAQTAAVQERIQRLKEILARLGKLALSRAESEFTRKLKPACDPADCGIETLRARLDELAAGAVLSARVRELAGALASIPALDLSSGAREEVRQLLERIHR